MSKRKKILLAVAIIFILVIDGLAISRLMKDSPAETTKSATIILNDGKPVSIVTYQAKNGDRLKFTILSDKDGEVTVASDTRQKVTINKDSKEINLVADRSGTFPLTFLPSGSTASVTIAQLQVSD